jgi:hypothetical protein
VLGISREQVNKLSLSVSAPGCMLLLFHNRILDVPPELELKLQMQAR